MQYIYIYSDIQCILYIYSDIQCIYILRTLYLHVQSQYLIQCIHTCVYAYIYIHKHIIHRGVSIDAL